MVNVSGPLMSLEAAGRFGQVLVYRKTRRGTSVYPRTKPGNPNTQLQFVQRLIFKTLANDWDTLDQTQKDTWINAIPLHGKSPFNAFIGYNLERWWYGQPPSKFYPQETRYFGFPMSISNVHAERNFIHYTCSWYWTTYIWRLIWFWNNQAPATFQPERLTHVGPRLLTGTHSYKIGPFKPGTWYGKRGTYSIDGDIFLWPFPYTLTLPGPG